MNPQPASGTELPPPNGLNDSSSTPALRELHGIPVNGLSDSYLFKVDAAEFSRLDLHHSMFSAALGGLFPASAREDVQNALISRNGHPKPAVLDIGTGSGAWSIDMANAFSNADVVGMDLVPVKASSIPPSNCRFEVGNADTDLALMYNAQSFNVIHARSMMQGVKDFHSFYQNVWRMLRPGGVFMTTDSRLTTWDEERQEIKYKEEGQSGFSWFRKTLYHMHEALKARNPNMDLMDSLADCIRDVGDDAWTKVDTFAIYFPVGNFDSPAISPGERLGGMIFTENMSMVPESVRPLLLSGGLTPEEADRLSSELKVELKNPKVKQFARLINTWAVKMPA